MTTTRQPLQLGVNLLFTDHPAHNRTNHYITFLPLYSALRDLELLSVSNPSCTLVPLWRFLAYPILHKFTHVPCVPLGLFSGVM